MNLLHLKYAVEIAKTGSMTKASENLFTSQPNLSRAIRELESTLGIEIFRRTSKGIDPTPQGEEFLGYARQILQQVDAVEEMYREGRQSSQRFSISVPRASYIAHAFSEFARKLDMQEGAELFYKETNSMRAIRNILNSDYKLGILRYQSVYDRHFKDMLEEKGLSSEPVCDFRYALLFSKNHPLASKKQIKIGDLAPFTEIAHADPYVPSLPAATVQKSELSEGVNRHVFIFERASQMDLLASVPGSFMWVSPVPQSALDRYGLVEKHCPENTKIYRDLLIYKKEYRFSEWDQLFIEELMRAKQAIALSEEEG